MTQVLDILPSDSKIAGWYSQCYQRVHTDSMTGV